MSSLRCMPSRWRSARSPACLVWVLESRVHRCDRSPGMRCRSRTAKHRGPQSSPRHTLSPCCAAVGKPPLRLHPRLNRRRRPKRAPPLPQTALPFPTPTSTLFSYTPLPAHQRPHPHDGPSSGTQDTRTPCAADPFVALAIDGVGSRVNWKQ